MKERVFNIFIIILSVFILLQLFMMKNIVYSSIMYAIEIWINNLLPTLFPFFIISDILINYNIVDYIPKIIKKFCQMIFRINDNMLEILFLSMISGFPSNARNTRMLYDNGCISLEEANHILMFSHFANPLFIITIANFFLHNGKVGIILLISHYFSNFILGIIFRNKNTFSYNKKNIHDKENDFGTILVLAIKRAIDSILTICGIMAIFLMICAIIINYFNLNIYNSMIIKGIFEITIGIQALSSLNISLCYKAIITSMILAFGGISVHMQVISQITGTKIKYIYFFIGRMYQMIISGIITYILFNIFIN